MSRIDQIQQGVVGDTQKKTGKAAKGDVSFQELLEKAGANEAAKTGSINEVQQLTAPPIVGQVAPVEAPAAVNSSVLGRAEELFSALEAYQQALADPSRSLKQVQPLLSALEGEAAQAREMLAGGDTPEELAAILDETVALAEMESIKFNRGDYI